jgi:hypothetical protein
VNECFRCVRPPRRPVGADRAGSARAGSSMSTSYLVIGIKSQDGYIFNDNQ